MNYYKIKYRKGEYKGVFRAICETQEQALDKFDKAHGHGFIIDEITFKLFDSIDGSSQAIDKVVERQLAEIEKKKEQKRLIKEAKKKKKQVA